MNVRPELASSGAQISSVERRQSWAWLGLFVLLLLLALFGATALARLQPAPPRLPFDRRPLEQLKRLRPAFVLIGNSMVDSRFEAVTLRHLLETNRVSVIGVGGSKSAAWYLMLKNLVVASGYRPRVFIFFREQELTEPRSRTIGTGLDMLQRLSVDDEAVVARKIAPPLTEPIARLAWERGRLMPFERLHERTSELVDALGMAVSRAFSHAASADKRKGEINALFALSNLRAAEVAQDASASDPAQVFARVLDRSFLPDICQVADEHHIPLTFVRVRTRQAASGVAETPAERRYVADLAAYVRSRGAEFYDLQDATWESLDLYGNGDHIAGRYKRAYTQLFVGHMRQIFH